MTLRVLIIGGGIGGLCLAQGLRSAGFAVIVFERDSTPRSRLQG
jgi:2-polyprenyl-6-methoxyphenol hydroxylase-like FAD-dependent oxidoreductase